MDPIFPSYKKEKILIIIYKQNRDRKTAIIEYETIKDHTTADKITKLQRIVSTTSKNNNNLKLQSKTLKVNKIYKKPNNNK